MRSMGDIDPCYEGWQRLCADSRNLYMNSSDRPEHDWASHGADALRYVALAKLKQHEKMRPIVYPELRGIV